MSAQVMALPRRDTRADEVERLRNIHVRDGFLRATIAGLHDGMAWAASALDARSAERQLLEQRIAVADRALALVAEADE